MQITGHGIFVFTFYLFLAYLWMPIAWIVMRFITPKVLVEKYFKKPHFTSTELALFAKFPGSLMRTMIFAALCARPQRGKNRQITDIMNSVPSWYATTSKWFVFFSVSHFLLALFLMIGLILFSIF